jgi:hypothetical protein
MKGASMTEEFEREMDEQHEKDLELIGPKGLQEAEKLADDIVGKAMSKQNTNQLFGDQEVAVGRNGAGRDAVVLENGKTISADFVSGFSAGSSEEARAIARVAGTIAVQRLTQAAQDGSEWELKFQEGFVTGRLEESLEADDEEGDNALEEFMIRFRKPYSRWMMALHCDEISELAIDELGIPMAKMAISETVDTMLKAAESMEELEEGTSPEAAGVLGLGKLLGADQESVLNTAREVTSRFARDVATKEMLGKLLMAMSVGFSIAEGIQSGEFDFEYPEPKTCSHAEGTSCTNRLCIFNSDAVDDDEVRDYIASME